MSTQLRRRVALTAAGVGLVAAAASLPAVAQASPAITGTLAPGQARTVTAGPRSTVCLTNKGPDSVATVAIRSGLRVTRVQVRTSTCSTGFSGRLTLKNESRRSPVSFRITSIWF